MSCTPVSIGVVDVLHFIVVVVVILVAAELIVRAFVRRQILRQDREHEVFRSLLDEARRRDEACRQPLEKS